MAQEPPPPVDGPLPPQGESPAGEKLVVVHHRGRAILKGIGIGLAAILFVIAAFLVWLNTDPGRRWITGQISGIETADGLRIGIDRIEGSIFGELRAHGLSLADPQGVFLRAPVVELDWRPLAYLRNHLDIRSLVVPEARLYRLPELIPDPDPDEDRPFLPDLDVTIGRLDIGRLMVDPPVTGQRHLVSLRGDVRIADGRARINADAGTIAGSGLAGGDRLLLRLDAAPDDDRFDLAMRLRAPGDGFVAGLIGVDQPLAAEIDGEGSWETWQGRARASLGGEGLADLAVRARNGTFNVQGPLNPGLIMEGPVQRLAAPHVQLNLVTTFAERRADLRLQANSQALSVNAQGMVDLGRSRFGNLRIAARLLQPGAIAPNLSGQDIRLNLVLDGAFSTPGVAYDLRGARLQMDDMILENFAARGQARVQSDRIILPVEARVGRILGLDEQIGYFLTNVALRGQLAIDGTRIVSDNMLVRSDRFNGSVVLAYDLGTGRYLTAFQGRIDNYLLDGVGIFDATTSFDLFEDARGFGLTGRVVARSRRVDAGLISDLFGEPITVSSNVAVDARGVIRFENIRLSGPLGRITQGSGTMFPDNRIAFSFNGVSNAYGGFTARIGGTFTAPEVQLSLDRPGFGIGLRGISADIRAVPRGWAITARGESDYGPFEADVVILTGRAQLTIEVNRLLFAGLTFSGTIVQSPAGPFVGTLDVAGQGLNGTVRLSAEGQHQRADIAATASGARIPGDTPILIQRGSVRATAILYPDAPAIVGDVQLAGLRSGDLLVETARGRIDYRGGRGRAQVVAAGRSGVPFNIAADAALTPDLIRVAARGDVNRIPFRLARPADLRPVRGGWELAPTIVVLPQGNIHVAGRTGAGTVLRARLQNVDMSIANAFSPGLGLGGRATGSVDFGLPAGGAFPRAEARLNIENFTRTGLTAITDPVNIAFAGALHPDGGRASAVIRRRGAIIGRAQANLQPLGPGAGPWMTRLMAAPLGGGIRYNGPAEVLWSLSGIVGHQLTGPIGVAADFSGRVQNPQFTGVLRANNLVYENEEFGSRITNLALQGRFTGSRFELTQLSGRAGQGTVTGRGTVDLSADAGFPLDIRLNFDNAQLARSDDLGATATGSIAITNAPGRDPLIAGEILLPQARYVVATAGAERVRELQGVRRRGEPLRAAAANGNGDDGVPSIWNLDLRLRAPGRILVTGMGLDSEWSADLRVQGTSATPRIIGELELVRGSFSFAGRRFALSRGEIGFTGQRPPNPLLDIQATSNIEGVEVAINVTGTGNDPQIALSSTPGLPQDEIASRILFGTSVTQISAIQAAQLAMSLRTLTGGGGGGTGPLGALSGAAGLERLRILGADEATGRGTAVAAGFYISNEIYIEVITDARGFTATQLEIALSRALSLLTQFGGTSGSAANIRYSRDY